MAGFQTLIVASLFSMAINTSRSADLLLLILSLPISDLRHRVLSAGPRPASKGL